MPLNWNVKKVKNYEELFNEGQMSEPYSTIAISTINVGINEITEKNYLQFYNRINMLERMHGTYFYYDRTPKYITEEDIKRLIGLHTNASCKTKTQFLKEFGDGL